MDNFDIFLNKGQKGAILGRFLCFQRGRRVAETSIETHWLSFDFAPGNIALVVPWRVQLWKPCNLFVGRSRVDTIDTDFTFAKVNNARLHSHGPAAALLAGLRRASLASSAR